ncbi:phosphate ABC transporter permease PstA [Aquihabitans daechungensis]|uniref:phosphate ABC transporter permease PstA n=1 Tax=Aquihabitans daechungensis TaxID=1052257 RepID=UPI003BA0C91F
MALTTPEITSQVVRSKLQGEKVDVAGKLFLYLIGSCIIFVLVALVALIVSVSGEGLEVLRARGLEDFIMRPFSINYEKAGIYQGMVGTVTCAVVVVLAAVPVGVASAVYLEEYATDNWFSRLVNVVIRNLAGVPAVVYGLLGYAIFVAGPFEAITGGSSLLSAGLTLSVLVLPIVVITSAEALRAVPGSLREGGYGVGATRFEVTRTLVLPNALPGILTGTILGLARALGEAAPLILVGATTGGFSGGEWGDLTGRFTALPNLISTWAKLPPKNWTGNTEAAILVTLVLILGINTCGIFLRNHFDKKR